MLTMNHQLRVVLADDHAVLRDGLARSLGRLGLEVVGQSGDGRSAVAQVEDLMPDVAVIDMSMPVMDGLAAVRTIHLRHPRLPIVVLSMHDDPQTREEARVAGASAYLTKDCTIDELVDTINRVVDELMPSPAHAGCHSRSLSRCHSRAGVSGEEAISDRELEVLRHLARGANTAEIGRTLYISQKTVKNHLSSIYQKLDARDRTQAVLRAMRIGLVSLD